MFSSLSRAASYLPIDLQPQNLPADDVDVELQVLRSGASVVETVATRHVENDIQPRGPGTAASAREGPEHTRCLLRVALWINIPQVVATFIVLARHWGEGSCDSPLREWALMSALQKLVAFGVW
jgi:hypothetical protein